MDGETSNERLALTTIEKAGFRLTIPCMPSQILWSFEDLAAVADMIRQSGRGLWGGHDELRWRSRWLMFLVAGLVEEPFERHTSDAIYNNRSSRGCVDHLVPPAISDKVEWKWRVESGKWPYVALKWPQLEPRRKLMSDVSSKVERAIVRRVLESGLSIAHGHTCHTWMCSYTIELSS